MGSRTITRMIAAVAAGGGLIAGCASTATRPAGTASSAAGGTTDIVQQQWYSQADVAFVQSMFPHHAQALAMAQLAASRAGSGQVNALAARIFAEDNPQMQQMSGLLTSWGAAVPVATESVTGMSQMPGMLSAAQMRQLAAATGPAFDRLFLQMMIIDHQGVVTMSATELDQVTNPATRQLTQQMITAEQAEIAQMQTLLQHPGHDW